MPGAWEAKYSQFVEFIKVLSKNWQMTIPELLGELSHCDISIDQFFKLERNVVFKFSALLSDVNTIQSKVLRGKNYDVSSFAARLSFAFLPPIVFQLEEYGLPRMLSRELHRAKVIDFENPALSLHMALDILRSIGPGRIKDTVPALDGFDYFLLDYFFEGISLDGQLTGTSN
jgi:hypothetical protein